MAQNMKKKQRNIFFNYDPPLPPQPDTYTLPGHVHQMTFSNKTKKDHTIGGALNFNPNLKLVKPERFQAQNVLNPKCVKPEMC